MFSSIHDTIANTNARMTPQLSTACLHSRILFSAVNQVDHHAFSVTIANLLGSIQTDHDFVNNNNQRTYKSYQSMVRQIFDATFNPILMRNYV